MPKTCLIWSKMDELVGVEEGGRRRLVAAQSRQTTIPHLELRE